MRIAQPVDELRTINTRCELLNKRTSLILPASKLCRINNKRIYTIPSMTRSPVAASTGGLYFLADPDEAAEAEAGVVDSTDLSVVDFGSSTSISCVVVSVVIVGAEGRASNIDEAMSVWPVLAWNQLDPAHSPFCTLGTSFAYCFDRCVQHSMRVPGKWETERR